MTKCEGMVRRGGTFTLGIPQWEKCKKKAEVMITVEQTPGGWGHKEDGEGTFPACMDCWKKAKETDGMKILKVEPIEEMKEVIL